MHTCRHPVICRDLGDLRAHLAGAHHVGGRIALVPTMGALHAGHLALVEKAGTLAGTVIVSIFVNPTQFGAGEDFTRYPRDEGADMAALAGTPVAFVWAPPDGVMYPAGFATVLSPKGAAIGLEGTVRPQHFDGVATVVLKLLNQVRPDFAVFGEKDYQQLCVVRQLVRDLDVAAHIVGVPTVREADGLALSSRNRYLSPAGRATAPAMVHALREAAAAIRAGSALAAATKAAHAAILAGGFDAVDYVAVRDAHTLSEPDPDHPHGCPLRILAAAWLGTTRLIDNVAV